MKYLFLLLLVVGCKEVQPKVTEKETDAPISIPSNSAVLTVTEQFTQDIPKIGAWIREQNPEIDTLSSFDKAIYVRHLIYSRVPFAQDNAFLLPERILTTPYTSLMYLVNQNKYGVRCGIIHRFFQFALASIGIKSRYVGLYSAVTGSYVGHSSTDVLVDNTWIAMDATFDLTIQDDQGNYISWSQARGSLFSWNNNGYPWPPGKTDTDWFTTLGTEYLTYIATFPGPDETETVYQSPDGSWSGDVETSWGPIVVDLFHSYLDIETNEAIREVTRRN